MVTINLAGVIVIKGDILTKVRSLAEWCKTFELDTELQQSEIIFFNI